MISNRLQTGIYVFFLLACLVVATTLTLVMRNENIRSFVKSAVMNIPLGIPADEELREEKPSLFAKSLGPLFAKPTGLKVSNTSIDISLVRVGVTQEGQLENPEDWNVGGWYKKSPRPGENGNIIINAHYDSSTGAPAAFWELKNVNVDDRVFLEDELGKVYTYKVSEKFYVDIDDPDRLKIFDDVEGSSELTLITCGGVWDYSAGTYNRRLVVKATLVDE